LQCNGGDDIGDGDSDSNNNNNNSCATEVMGGGSGAGGVQWLCTVVLIVEYNSVILWIIQCSMGYYNEMDCTMDSTGYYSEQMTLYYGILQRTGSVLWDTTENMQSTT
jgi:hypothetical protein